MVKMFVRTVQTNVVTFKVYVTGALVCSVVISLAFKREIRAGIISSSGRTTAGQSVTLSELHQSWRGGAQDFRPSWIGSTYDMKAYL